MLNWGKLPFPLAEFRIIRLLLPWAATPAAVFEVQMFPSTTFLVLNEAR
jgi:hypothetical protein